MLLSSVTPSLLDQLLVYTPWVNAISVTYGLVPRRCKEPENICNIYGVGYQLCVKKGPCFVDHGTNADWIERKVHCTV